MARVESAFGPADPRLRFPLDGLAQDLRDLGEYAEARSVAERSLSLSEHTFGPDHPAVAKSLYTLATVLAEAGDHAGAIRRLEAATRIGLRRDVNRATGPRGALTDVLRSSGVTERDAPLFVRLVAFRESRYGPARPAAGETLVALAALLSTEEDTLRTRPLFEQSLAAEEAALGPSHPDIATIALNLADVLARAGDAAAATRLYERAVRIREQALGSQHPKLAAALAGLAREHLKAARYGEARSLLERALTIEQATLGPTHPEVAATLVSLAELEARCGNAERAFEAAARAEDIRQAHVRLVVRALSERQAQSYAFSGVSPADVMLSVVAGRPGDRGMASAAWNLVISGRGVVLDEMAERHRVATTTGGEAALSLSRQLAAAREQLAAAVVRGIRDDSPERYRQLLDTARRDKERAELELAAESAAFGAARSPTAPRLREVADALPGGSALVAFVRYGGLQLGPGSAPPNGRAARPSYLAFVLRSANDTPFVVPLGPAAAIDGSIEKWRQQIDRQSVAPEWTARAGEAAYRRVASGLRRQIWDPLAPHLLGAERVFVVPDGAIHLVSVAALPSATTGYLAERGPLVHYLSAERDVVREQPGPSRASGLLAFGGVAFDERGAALAAGSHQFRGLPPSCPDFASLRFDPLPASLQEVDQVTQVWTRAQQRQPEPIGDGAARPASPGATLLAGAAASESAFKAEAGAHEVVHVATHGFFLDERCGARPGAPEASLARLPVPPAIARGNPLLLSGLAFAGANERGAVAPGDDDGILTAEEIASLDLSGVAWAVLSACEAGNGAIKASEGVFGLRRAFQLAGARTVIMSLWRVEDRATRDWMVVLYQERFGKGLDTAGAVRAASLDVLRRRRAAARSTHPFYWAGFVAAGEWR